jgi:UDP-N-acetylmuramyl pentapeptide phosphotransferase/UDP-N-acetylglucosamine-1-phosphate transferase
VSIVGPAKGLTTVSLLLPLLILSLPLADMSAVIMGRLREGRSPFYPDRRHLHHRLLRAGFSHRRTVLLIYVFTQWLAALALVVANAEMRFPLAGFGHGHPRGHGGDQPSPVAARASLMNTNPLSTPC